MRETDEHESVIEGARRVARFERLRQDRRALRRQDALAGGLEEARRLASWLRDRYGVTRVILFGSMARGDPSDRADIDLAVEGLEPGQRSEVLGALLFATQASVDLVDLASAPPHLRARIEGEGVELP